MTLLACLVGVGLGLYGGVVWFFFQQVINAATAQSPPRNNPTFSMSLTDSKVIDRILLASAGILIAGLLIGIVFYIKQAILHNRKR